jgi:hypothetical protein
MLGTGTSASVSARKLSFEQNHVNFFFFSAPRSKNGDIRTGNNVGNENVSFLRIEPHYDLAIIHNNFKFLNDVATFSRIVEVLV